jgi:phage shock protein PspC (stress-responsive transcriptional regulator)
MRRSRKKRSAWKRLLEYFGIKRKTERKLFVLVLFALVVIFLLAYWLIAEFTASYK